MINCNIDGCEFESKYSSKCALHCDKSDSQIYNKKGLLSDFYNLLIDCISNENSKLLEYKKDTTMVIGLKSTISEGLISGGVVNQKNIKKYLGGTNANVEIKDIVSSCVANFEKIIFPDRDERDSCDYFKVLNKMKGVHFDRCVIHFTEIDVQELELFFQDCVFLNDWNINSYSMLDNINKVIFQDCKFNGNVSAYVTETSTKRLIINTQLFNDCSFSKQVSFIRIEFEESIYKNDEDYEQNLNQLVIENCKFTGRFLLNKSNINRLLIKNSEFYEKFELKENVIEDIELINVNYKKLFDAYDTKFKQFKISRSIFDDFTGFEKCEFGKENDVNGKVTEFEYATFLHFANFRKAKFYNGLDFEHTNLKEPLNFLGAEINDKKTNRETYRILKHSFDKIGNQIEANKYFSLEMKKYKEELKESSSKSELFIYRVNEKISNFGASYLKPAFLMLASAFIYYLLVKGYECNLLYIFIEPGNGFINEVNLFAKGIPPYGKLLKEGMEFITLMFHLFFLTCTWQFIVAVKRRTKR
ncbi:MAG: hypothetical protein JKY88_17270 [Pseudomonadales bacterium]|nr:hypothetical protein [Pseudomonadales bacterium]